MENQSTNIELLYQEAMQAYQIGKADQAESLLREILIQAPNNDGIVASLGGLLLSTGKIQEGIDLLSKAIQLNDQNAEAHLNLGLAFQNSGRAEEGMSLINKASSLAPENINIQFNYANILLQHQQYSLAIEVLNKVIKINPNFTQAYLSLGAVYNFLQNKESAQSVYDKILGIAPNDLNVLITVGNFYLESDQIEKAESVLLNAQQKFQNHFLPYAALGKLYLGKGQEARAKEFLEKSYSFNPNDLNTNILLGTIFKNNGDIENTEKYFQNALRINPNDTSLEQELRRILATKIPYWHFEMLADVDRNDAYQKAIEKKVNSDSIILDIGTGSGLLSMMAARAGAQQITACEMHQRLAATAKEIVKINGFENTIKILAKKSNLVKIGEEMPSKANLIISEILDVGALGEGVLPSIRHAVQNLATPNVQLIPSAVNLYGQLIEIPSRSLVAPIRKISGFDLSPFEKYRISDEYLKVNLKGEKYKSLSPVIPLLNIDFYNLPPVYSKEQPNQIPLTIPVSESGVAQAFVFWFDLFLDDEIVVSSKVNGKLEHWGQALFCFPNPSKVEKGEELVITMLQSDTLIRFRK